MGQLAVDDETQARDCQWSPAGERQLADVEQAAEQAQDDIAGDVELVSARTFFTALCCCLGRDVQRVNGAL